MTRRAPGKNRLVRSRRLFALALAGASTLVPGAAIAEPPVPDAADAVVSTYAGSGEPGLRDGPAAAATFLEPVGVTAEGGALLVADAAAQRIRRIDASGIVSTLAGSGGLDATGLFVPGGYADGAAATARFSGPSGVAVAPDGALIVADRYNHCLRRITGGVVTTYAGAATEPGNADGTLATARFREPLGVTYDPAGNLFVADFGSGVREIDTAGRVSTPVLPPGRGLLVTSVAVQMESGHEIVFAALQSGVVRLDLSANVTGFYVAGKPPPDGPNDSMQHLFVDARRDVGAPYAIAPFGPLRIVYTDLENHAVRVLWNRRERVLAGGDADDAPFADGAYRDGAGGRARFDAPAGIARVGASTFAIADSGNRRIRLLSLRTPPDDGIEALGAAAGRAYRIAYVGNSYVDYDGDTSTSISSLVERGLNERAATLGLPQPARLFTVKLLGDAAAIGSYIRNSFAGTANLVIWQLNSAEVSTAALAGRVAPAAPLSTNAATLEPALERELRATRDALAADRVRLVVVLNPMPWEISPSESAYQRLYDLALPPFDIAQRDGEVVRAALRRSGVDAVDLFPLFRAAELTPAHVAEFGTLDHHFSDAGRALTAHAIVDALARQRPWAAPR